MPLLLLGAKSSSDGKARVINLSSAGHLTGGLDFNTFKDGPTRRRGFTVQLYAQSKFVCDFSVPVKYTTYTVHLLYAGKYSVCERARSAVWRPGDRIILRPPWYHQH
jgi:hypothetical protein